MKIPRSIKNVKRIQKKGDKKRFAHLTSEAASRNDTSAVSSVSKKRSFGAKTSRTGGSSSGRSPLSRTSRPFQKNTLGKSSSFKEAPRAPRTPRSTQKSTLPEGYERLERYLAHAGIASRREAKDMIAKGLVTVNGKIITEAGYGIQVAHDQVACDQQHIVAKETFLLYKPRGIETNATQAGSSDIHTRYPKLKHLAPIGRLDKDSEGLILLSNDGTLARALTQQHGHVEKEYEVTVREDVSDQAIQQMSEGIILDGEPTLPALVARRGRHTFSIVLKEGRKHQIRRMCDACHLTVTELVRVRIGHLLIRGMIAGNVKYVPPEEVQRLKETHS